MVGNRTVSDATRSKKLSRPENPPFRRKDRRAYRSDEDDDAEEVKDVDAVNGEDSTSSSSTASSSSSESEAAEKASDHSAAEQRGEDSDDEEIRVLFEQKVGKQPKKNGGKNQRTESSGRTSGVKKMSKREILKKRIVEEEEEDEKESERGDGSSACKFPMNRIHKIMKDQDSTAKISQEAIFLTNKALEKFLELYCKEAYACAFLDHKSQIAYDHLASVVSKRKRFDFLTDIVPERVKADDALSEVPVADE